MTKVLSGKLRAAELQARIYGLRQSIEEQVAPRALALTRQAENFCDQVEVLEAFDQQLRAAEGYPKEGFISRT